MTVCALPAFDPDLIGIALAAGIGTLAACVVATLIVLVFHPRREAGHDTR
jgi:hypothetical protein